MSTADCPLCGGKNLPLRRNGSFRSHPARPGGMVTACPATGRKPLTWHERVPACDRCWAWLNRPWMAEAIASVGIETGGVDVHKLVGAYHLNRHEETK